MRVRVISAFRANGQVYHVGDEVDLADAFAAEMVFCRKAVVKLGEPEAKAKRRPRRRAGGDER